MGLFFVLIPLNIIKTDGSSFSFGKLPVFLIGIDFAFMGFVVAFTNYKEAPKTILRKLLVLLFFIFFLIPFHIVAYRAGSIGFFVIVGFFDLAILYMAGYLIYKAVKTTKKI